MAQAEPSATTGITGVGVYATFSGKGFANGDTVTITADRFYLAGCVNGSGKYVPADLKKVGGESITGSYSFTADPKNGVVSDGVIYSTTVSWPPSGSPDLNCPTGQTPTYIGVVFENILLTWSNTRGVIDSEYASPSTQTWTDPAYKVNG